ncbi:hypothetical protein PISL3812_08684 [Talaromyces islandicus]|uniref:Uncharacterized protein n=1 Tax=Talaromyces islandicus TaxID=28573 RepID=A0A0U1M7L3_TALIS|nr:hypothetical protein PISL3812_08684 [Talaromyces islandicus]
MPRFTFLRLVKGFFLFWPALVGLWLFLPSPGPPRTADLRDQLIQSSLTSGQVLHTVHEWHASYAGEDASGHVPRPSDDCAGLLIDWHLLADAQHESAVLLEVGEHTTLNLTDAILKSAEEENSVRSGDSKSHNALSGIYVSDLLSVEVRAGDENHIINMPWFRWADMALFHNQMHEFTYTIDLRLVAHQTGPARVEIWKASSLAGADASHLLNPQPADRELGLLASFADIQPTYTALTSIHVADVKGDLPSKTYPIRSFILFYLAPFLTVCLFLAIYLAAPVLTVLLPVVAVYVVIVALCWCVAVRRPDYRGFAEWRASFWMTRYVSCCCCSSPRRHRGRRRQGPVVIWGPTGPVYESDRNESDSLVGSRKRGR